MYEWNLLHYIYYLVKSNKKEVYSLMHLSCYQTGIKGLVGNVNLPNGYYTYYTSLIKWSFLIFKI